MKFVENPTQSAEYLRQAIPLMVKYNIPPNPLNYALWYTYVSNRIPTLNFQIDQTIETYGTCPTMMSEQLFRQHVINEEIEHSEKAQAEFISIATKLGSKANAAAQETSEFRTILEESLIALNNPENANSLDNIINNLSEHTESLNKGTIRFQKELEASQAEILKLKKELQKSRQDASIDPLTGLFNRRVFDTELSQIIGARGDKSATLVMIDVDHFKRFNDDYGHLMGDKVLQYFGKLLKEECPEPMLPVRFGGEEFAILMIGKDQDQAISIAETLREKIQSIRIKQKKTGKVISSITASFGVCMKESNETAQQLIERADKALYAAKGNGRNCVVTV